MSELTVAGNLTRDPELRYSQNAKATPYCTFGVAFTPRMQVDGEWVDGETIFYDVVAFGALGENCAESIGKGTRVVVSGRHEVETFTRKDGTPGTANKILADEVGVSLKFKALR